MDKQLFYKVFFYMLGIVFIAFGIALHNQHNFGNGPFTQFSTILAEIFSMNLGTMMMVIGFFIMIIYFIIKRNKDIYLSVIATLILGNVVNFFNYTFFYGVNINSDDIFLRVILFIVAINIVCIGIVMMVKSDLSMMDMELATILLNDLKPLRRFNFGQVRMVLDGTVVIISMLLSLIFLNILDITQYFATFFIFFLGGPLINIYLKIYDKISNKPETFNKD